MRGKELSWDRHDRETKGVDLGVGSDKRPLMEREVDKWVEVFGSGN